MKTDSFFYRFFLAFPQAFFMLIGQKARKAQNYKFASIEVKDIAFRFDGIFVPKIKGALIYFFESGRLQRVYLADLPKAALEKFPLNLLKIIIDSKKKAVSTAEKIIRQLPKQVPNEKQQEIIVELLENLVASKLPNMSRKEIEKMFEPVLSDIKKSRFYREIYREVYREAYREVVGEVAQESSLKEKRKIARTMLKKNFSLELIAEATGLSQKEMRALKKKLAERRN